MKKIVLIMMFVTAAASGEWVQVNNGIGNLTISAFTSIGNNLFTGTTAGVYLSANNGNNWSISLSGHFIYSLTAAGSNVLAGTDSGLYISTNNGTSWALSSFTQSVRCLASGGGNSFLGNCQGIYRSTNNGASWIQVLPLSCLEELAVNGNYVYAAHPVGVHLSTNSGSNWTWPLYQITTSSIAVNGSNAFAGFDQGISRSTNNGANWTLLTFDHPAYSITVSGNNVFAGGSDGVFVSNNNGLNWTQRNEGLSAFNINILFTANNFLFAGMGNSGGVYRRPLSELIGIQPISTEIPNGFSLSQNYPNPFNPTTKIQFQIPLLRGVSALGGRGVYVKLTVFDALGREVETIVSEQLAAGTYEADFDGSNYTSGIYFYVMKTESFTETRKMALIK